ncbi:MAG: NUDIX hydrolase, partial [Methylophilaceae bacterium]|nr:NUDIX hydrolase [Methylophilaceae bacterium]
MKLKKRKLINENKVFNFFLDHIEDKSNKEIELEYLVIETKSSICDVTGVSILPIIGTKVLLIKIYRHAIGKEIYEVPRGFVDSNDESIYESASRELYEETGLSCKADDLTHFQDIYPEPGIFKAKIALFFAKIQDVKKLKKIDEIGHKSFNFFTKDELVNLI